MNFELVVPAIVVAFALYGRVARRRAARWLGSSRVTSGSDSEVESADDDISFGCPSHDWDCGDVEFTRGCVNPATGLPMISGDCGGFDAGGNVYGDDGSTNAIEPLDVFESTDSSDWGGIDFFGTSE